MEILRHVSNCSPYKTKWSLQLSGVTTSVLIFQALLSILRCQSNGIQMSEEYLLNYLFNGYNPLARPVLNSSQTVSVNLQFSLLQIQDLDWVDERLTWNDSISKLDEIVVDGGNIWRPEFAVINGAESIYGEYLEFQAVLRRDGRVRWEPGGVFRTMCPIDITNYPFDEQTCELKFGAWSYYTTKMNLTTDESDRVNLQSYEENGEWEVIETAAARNEFFFEFSPDQKFSNIAFSVLIRRRPEFYVMNVILPGLLTSAVLLSIFYCVPSQKVHIGSAALLSFRLFLLNVADTVPRTSDHVPVLGIYLTCTMAITTGSMVATSFVGNLYDRKDRPVPGWAQTLLLYYAARILGYCTRCVDSPPTPSASPHTSLAGPEAAADPSVENGDRPTTSTVQSRRIWRPEPSYRLVTLLENPDCTPRLTPSSPCRSRAPAATSLLPTQPSSASDFKEGVEIEDEDDSDTQSPQSGTATSASAATIVDRQVVVYRPASGASVGGDRAIRLLSRNHPNDLQTSASSGGENGLPGSACGGGVGARRHATAGLVGPVSYSKDWANVAAICDRLFFWICFVLTLITTVLLFHPLMWRLNDVAVK